MECVTEFWEAPASADRTASAKVLDVALDAFELIVMCTPRDHDGYRLLLERFRLAALDLHFGLVGIMTSTHPPLPEGVTHWDDLALLVSPDRVRRANVERRETRAKWTKCSTSVGSAVQCHRA